MAAQAFYAGDRARRQRHHDEYTGGNMLRFRTTAWDHEMRSETVAVNVDKGNVRMKAKYAGRCVECDGRIEVGSDIEYNPTSRKAMHVQCPENAEAVADRADDLLAQYEAAEKRKAAEAVKSGAIVPPVGKYTIRPADEKIAAVLSIEEPTFGNFPTGTRVVALHGSFVVKVRGLSESRSWLQFGIIRPDGSFGLYRNMRELLEMPFDAVPAERMHERDKVRAAVKAIRLMLAADLDTILTYGKTWAAVERKCWVCGHGLLDEASQRRGIGPVCLRNVSRVYGA